MLIKKPNKWQQTKQKPPNPNKQMQQKTKQMQSKTYPSQPLQLTDLILER